MDKAAVRPVFRECLQQQDDSSTMNGQLYLANMDPAICQKPWPIPKKGQN